MGGIGSQELFLIIFFALIVFGARRIPEIMRGLGKGLSEFKRAARDIQNEIEQEIDLDTAPPAPRTLPPPPSSPEVTEHQPDPESDADAQESITFPPDDEAAGEGDPTRD